MAWLMGFIRHNNGPLKSQRGAHYAGWVDSQTEMPIQDMEVKAKYEEKILKHSGIRLIGTWIQRLFALHLVLNVLQSRRCLMDMTPTASSSSSRWFSTPIYLRSKSRTTKPSTLSISTATRWIFIPRRLRMPVRPSFARNFWRLISAHANLSDATWTVRFRKGATLYVPKALRFDRLVAGQIPTGWDAKRYGIPDDIVNQVDPVTLYVLVATAEALMTAGISDPYEFYKYVHVSEVRSTRCVSSADRVI